ncbi:MAG: glycoside hydrolase family 3 protein [Erysipelotrichaceae bacterium]|nr:glycoside hydrolase family 3 protein [Erysipelotrichaceae bacterium]
MKKQLLLLLLVCAVLFSALSGCSKKEEEEDVTPEDKEETVPDKDDKEPEEKEEEKPEEDTKDGIREKIEQMSVEEKLAQMMIVALRSDAQNTYLATEMNDDYYELLKKYGFGGVILFGGNMESIEQTVTLINDVQSAAKESGAGIPMFLCVDQEGGMVNRVSFGLTGCGNMALAAAGDPALTKEMAKMLGNEIYALGFNMDFAPDADVNSNPANPIIGVRSFSDDPSVVAKHVTAFVRGLKEAKISGALKHFPGHGNVGEDSHTHLPLSEYTLEELRTCELIPFEEGIRAGADMIMTAHIQFPKIETETYISKKDGKEVTLPATLSYTIITDLLRKEMGYDGVIITDAMDMDAIASHFDPIDAAVLAINSGVDILLCPVNLYKGGSINTFPVMEEYMAQLSLKAQEGIIKEEELDDSVYRILKLKEEKGILDEADTSLDERIAIAKKAVGTAENCRRQWEITLKAMTLLKNDNGALPLDPAKDTLILIPSEYRKPAVDYALARLKKEGIRMGGTIEILSCNRMESSDRELRNALEEAEQVVLLSQSASRSEVLTAALNTAKSSGKSTVLLSLNLPYDSALYKEADAIVCAYQPYGSAYDEEGNGPFNLNVATAFYSLYQSAAPQGSLPVNIPEAKERYGEVEYLKEILYPRGYSTAVWKE